MAGRVIRLVCITLISIWVTGKVTVFSPILAIALIGATVLYMINEITEIKNEKNKSRKKSKGNKKVARKQS